MSPDNCESGGSGTGGGDQQQQQQQHHQQHQQQFHQQVGGGRQQQNKRSAPPPLPPPAAVLSGESDPSTPSNSRPVSAGSKMMAVKVLMLDDSITLFQVQTKAPGRILFDQVCKQLNLLEVDYFGLEYHDVYNVTYWLDLDKQMNHQVGLPTHPSPSGGGHHHHPSSSSGGTPAMMPTSATTASTEPLLRFCVKFYTPDPAQIEEEYTRYLFSLQIKRDLSVGQLQCNDNTAALMASYIVQAECGDYVIEDYPDHTYLSTFKFVPQQDSDLERRIMENHKKHIGQPPAEADMNLLETARRCELYGTKMHAAKDHEGVPLNLAVSHSGVLVFQNYTKINTFSWAKIRKLSFKRKKFLIKLHPEGYGYYKDTVEFYFEDRNHCKNFWKKCVEHHTFFRCSATVHRERERRRLLSRGSSFRYSGKTQKQMQEYVRENFVKRQSFQRHVRNLHSTSLGNVGQSLSAQPLLPIGDNGVAGQTFSLSCGAMTSFSDLHPDQLDQLDQFRHHLHQQQQQQQQQQRYLHQHQSANSTPRRSNQGISFGYATLQPQLLMNGSSSVAPSYSVSSSYRPHSMHDAINHAAVSGGGGQQGDSDAEATSCSLSSRTTGTDLRSETTVVEKANGGRRASSASRRSSNRSNRSQTSVHSMEDGVGSGGSNAMIGPGSSEDNLSHESYDLIDKEEEEEEHLVVIETTRMTNTFPKGTSVAAEANLFEREFYRQAGAVVGAVLSEAQQVVSQIHGSRSACSSKLSSVGGSLTSSSSLGLGGTPIPTALPLHEGTTVPILKQAVRRKSSSASNSAQQQQQQSGSSQRGSRQSLAEYYDVVRAPPQQQQLPPQPPQASTVAFTNDFRTFHTGANLSNPDHSQTLPRFPRHQQQPQQQQRPQMQQHIPAASGDNKLYFSSRTLPNRRREKSPVFFSRARPGQVGGNVNDISSASSSSQASPQMLRPKSLDFAVVSASALPSKNAFSYRDDTIDQPVAMSSSAGGGGMMEYDDSSSAVSGLNELNFGSSSDVAQTPEMPTVQFPGMETMIDSSVYHNVAVEERIYDVPEGIEGVTDHVSYMRSQQQAQHSQYLPLLPRSVPPPLPPHQCALTSPMLLPSGADPNPASRYHAQMQQHYSSRRAPIRLPPPPRTSLLPTMSSTESESAAFSARSAPTPVGNPEALIQMVTSERHKQQQQQQESKGDLSVGLISPPEESESSTAVIESENVPAPPEFSGAGVVSVEQASEDRREDTDVEEEDEEDSASCGPFKKREKEDEEVMEKIEGDPEEEEEEEEERHELEEDLESPLCAEAPEDVTTSRESTVKRRHDILAVAATGDDEIDENDEVTAAEGPGDETDDFLGSVITLESPPTVFGEETESTDQINNGNFRIAEMYVRLGNGSTISSNGDSDSVRYIDDESSERNNNRQDSVPGNGNGSAGAGAQRLGRLQKQATEEDISPHCSAMMEMDPPVPLPPKDLLITSARRPKLMLHSSESMDGSLDIASIPPPAASSAVAAADQPIASGGSVAAAASADSPVLLDPAAAAAAESATFLQRTLSRISENSSSDNGKPFEEVGEEEEEEEEAQEEVEEEEVEAVEEEDTCGGGVGGGGGGGGIAAGGAEEEVDAGGAGDDTLSEPNYTTSEDNENPPSLNSDLPENAGGSPRGFGGQQQQQGQLRTTTLTTSVVQIVRECGVELGGEIEFPSPPSSIIEGNQTEFTQLEADSLDFLEVTPPELQRDDWSGGSRKDQIPYDLSISSENNVTGRGGGDGGGGGGGEEGANPDDNNSDDASLHDSMEILEEIATEDHFEREVVEESEDEWSQPRPLPLPQQQESQQQEQQMPEQQQQPQQERRQTKVVVDRHGDGHPRTRIVEKIITEEVIL